MEAIFTLPYSEYEVINVLKKHLTKKEGYAIYIPTSRQQKGVDLIIHNYKSNKIARVQVKSSRAYVEKDGSFGLWFNNFLSKYEKNNADFYILFGLYPEYEEKRNIKKGNFWKEVLLCIAEDEMFGFLDQVKTKKGISDRFFGFNFVTPDDIKCIRGPKDFDVKQYLIKSQIKELKTFLA